MDRFEIHKNLNHPSNNTAMNKSKRQWTGKTCVPYTREELPGLLYEELLQTMKGKKKTKKSTCAIITKWAKIMTRQLSKETYKWSVLENGHPQ